MFSELFHVGSGTFGGFLCNFPGELHQHSVPAALFFGAASQKAWQTVTVWWSWSGATSERWLEVHTWAPHSRRLTTEDRSDRKAADGVVLKGATFAPRGKTHQFGCTGLHLSPHPLSLSLSPRSFSESCMYETEWSFQSQAEAEEGGVGGGMT